MSAFVLCRVDFVLFPLDGAWRLVGDVVPEGTGAFGYEATPEALEEFLVDFGEVGCHGLGAIYWAHNDTRLVGHLERCQYDRHLPDLLVEIVLLKEFGTDIIEFT